MDQTEVNSIISRVTDVPLVWQLIIALFFFMFLLFEGSYRVVKKRNFRIAELEMLLNNRKAKDKLALDISELYKKHKNSPGLYNLGEFCRDMVSLLEKSNIVEPSVIDEFRDPRETWFTPAILDERIRELKKSLKY